MNCKVSHFLQTEPVNEKSACNNLDTTKKVPVRSERMVSLFESRHTSLGERVTEGGNGDANGRKDPVHAAGHPATFIKFIQTVSNLKVQTLTAKPLILFINIMYECLLLGLLILQSLLHIQFNLGPPAVGVEETRRSFNMQSNIHEVTVLKNSSLDEIKHTE